MSDEQARIQDFSQAKLPDNRSADAGIVTIRQFLAEQAEYHRHASALDRIELHGSNRETSTCDVCRQERRSTRFHEVMEAMFVATLKTLPAAFDKELP